MDIFSPNLKRNELISYAKMLDFHHCKAITINVHRNHAFEPIQSIIAPFLYQSSLNATFNLSDYDDSLQFHNIQKADIELIWLDTTRYKDSFKDYLAQRIQVLKSHSNAPIITILTDSKNLALHSCDIKSEIFDTFSLLQDLDSKEILDLSKFDITGTRLSNLACLRLAQILGLSIIPSVILPTLKAIVLDLDNTLYQGILGEDGIDNITLTPEHIALQKQILAYKKLGFLLAICSKNESKDVEKLFKSRKDFILQYKDFDCIKANWNPKKENLQEIARYFNIGLDSMLFLDDNIAEIESIKDTSIKYILATNPKETLRILQLFPQMRKTKANKEDSLRSLDIQANNERKALLELSDEQYFKNLQIKLEFSINDKANLARITELLNKTNQFIANYARPTSEEVKHWLDSNEYGIISIAMSDRLSDSGNIAIIIGKKSNENLEIIEIAVSCRALGRKLESIMLYKSFELLCEKLQIDSKTIFIYYQKGERNAPFLNTLANMSKIDIENLQDKDSIKVDRVNPNTNGLEIVIKNDREK